MDHRSVPALPVSDDAPEFEHQVIVLDEWPVDLVVFPYFRTALFVDETGLTWLVVPFADA